MAKADPENEMAHFSLGSAYVQAGRHADAAASYLRCTELAPSMSKAYQLAGESLITTGDKEQAAGVLTRGYTIAAERGDLMPKNAMADLLTRLGRPIPEVAARAGKPAGKSDVSLLGGAARSPATDVVEGRKPGEPGGGTRMPKPPFRGPLGEWIQSNVPAEKWELWIAQGTKVINELRLDLSRDEDASTYDQHMREFLGIDDSLHEKILASR
jgi:Fe-S cluster biosynthesis and repair protein YggX